MSTPKWRETFDKLLGELQSESLEFYKSFKLPDVKWKEVHDLPETAIPYGSVSPGILFNPETTLEYWKSVYRQMDLERDPKESIASSLRSVIRNKLDKYHKEHGERANVIVLAPEYRILIGKDILDFQDIPIIYSLNLTSETNFEKSIQVF